MNVAVVGAGIAGLSAARALHDRGDSVVVFERTSAPGGRVATRIADKIELPMRGTADLSFDHGAQYFTVRDERFSEVVAYWLRDNVVSKWTGRIVAFDGEGWEELGRESGDGSRESGSREPTDRYVGTPGMSAISEHMARGLDVRFGQRIESLDALKEFDRIILAIPAERARPLLGGFPELLTRIAGVSMQPCWAVMAAFEERVPAPFDAAFVSGSPLGWIARNSSKPASPKHGEGGPKRERTIDTWVLHATTAWSHAHIDDRPDAVAPFLLEAFDDLVRAGLPRVFHVAAHRWKYATADPGLSVGALHEGRVSVCGDWCRGPRIEDAFLSGLAGAEFGRG
jgi:predicted NAD/FAD-dependent oxidoreductase